MNKTQNIIELQKKLNKLLGSEFNSWEMGIYDQGEWVINPFSGVKYYLNHILRVRILSLMVQQVQVKPL